MTIKQQFEHGVIQNVCNLHNGIFHLIHLCHTLSFVNFSASPPLCHLLKITNYRMREKKNIERIPLDLVADK